MYSEKIKRKPVDIAAVCLLALSAALLITGIRAKYITSVPLSGMVVFSADLADSVILTEHKATRNEDGTYTLGTGTTNANSYEVMPGVDIPKDPFFTIEDKSSIPVYLYVEIVEKNLPDTVTYELTYQWQDLSINGRKVYVYTGTISEGTEPQKIEILKDNMVRVSEKYDPSKAAFDLEFYGYMAQQVSRKTAAEIFNENFPSVP